MDLLTHRRSQFQNRKFEDRWSVPYLDPTSRLKMKNDSLLFHHFSLFISFFQGCAAPQLFSWSVGKMYKQVFKKTPSHFSDSWQEWYTLIPICYFDVNEEETTFSFVWCHIIFPIFSYCTKYFARLYSKFDSKDCNIRQCTVVFRTFMNIHIWISTSCIYT